MPSAVVALNNKQMRSVSSRKSEDECFKESANDADETFQMQNWIKRFDELFAALVKSERNQMKSSHLFSITLQVEGFEISDIDMVVDVDRKLYVKGKREVEEEDGEVFIEELDEVIPLPQSVDDEEIHLIKETNGYLTITAPFLNENRCLDDYNKSNKIAVVNHVHQQPKEWKHMLEELFVAEVEPLA